MPVKWQTNIRRFLEVHPDYDVKMWSLQEVTDLITTYYKDWLPVWHIIMDSGSKITAIDIARFFILHYHGGIYIDCDIEIIWCSIDPIIGSSSACFVMEKSYQIFGQISNCFMAFSPGHKFLNHCLKTIIDLHNRYKWFDPQNMFKTGSQIVDVLFISGPVLLTFLSHSYLSTEHGDTYIFDIIGKLESGALYSDIFCNSDHIRVVDISSSGPIHHDCNGTWLDSKEDFSVTSNARKNFYINNIPLFYKHFGVEKRPMICVIDSHYRNVNKIFPVHYPDKPIVIHDAYNIVWNVT